ncbi:hypothetical protein ACQ4WY_18260 [Janthinobacterium sp. LB2P49]
MQDKSATPVALAFQYTCHCTFAADALAPTIDASSAVSASSKASGSAPLNHFSLLATLQT